MRSQLSRLSRLLVSENAPSQWQQVRTGFNSIPVQLGTPPTHNLPEDHDKILYDGSAHPEPIMDLHWYTDPERGMPLYKYVVGQFLFFGFCYATHYVSQFVLPGGTLANGERPAMGFLPFGDHYLERGGDPNKVPAHIYRHIKNELPESHSVELLDDAKKMNDLTFASYNASDMPETVQKSHAELFPPFSWIHGLLGTNKPPSMRPNEHWYAHPEYRGVKIVGGLPLDKSE